MVSKDWKKPKNRFSKTESAWENKKTGTVIAIDKNKYSTINKWGLNIWTDKRLLQKDIIESFKTKAQALKFAKSYMSKH